jgi:hypothetical protein
MVAGLVVHTVVALVAYKISEFRRKKKAVRGESKGSNV